MLFKEGLMLCLPPAAIYIVQGADLPNLDSIRAAVEKYCDEIARMKQR